MYRVRTVMTGVAGSPYYSNLYFTQEGGTVAQARAAVINFWSGLASLMTDNTKLNVENDVPIIDEVTGDIISVATDPASGLISGTNVGTALPPATQALIRTRTGAFSGGREIRGRVFVPSMVTTSNDDGRVMVSAMNGINSEAAELIASANAQWVVWAKSKGQYAVINSASTWDQWAVLTSRRD